MPPSFAGISGFFGRSVRIKTTDKPTPEQLTHYFGLTGSEAISGGFEGRVSLASGIIFGTSYSLYAAARESFRALQDGQYYTLVDTVDVTWINVRLNAFDPAVEDRIWRDAYGNVLSHYTAGFLHLS